VKCFHRVNRWVNLLIRLVKALHEGCWLGLLDADDLNAVTSAYYAEASYYASKEHTRMSSIEQPHFSVSCFASEKSR
jgi:hypothetical protein